MKKKNTAAICAAVGVCVLTTAAFASYQTANGYDSLKKSLLGAIDYTNCTITGSVAMSFDEKELLTANCLLEADYPNNAEHTRSESFSVVDGDSVPYVSETFDDSKYHYYDFYDMNGERTSLIRYERGDVEPQTNLLGIDDDERGTFDKVTRFMELAADTVVGDLRNNFVCTEDNDDSVSYSIMLDSVQIPELVNAGLSMVFSLTETEPYYYSYDENGNEYTVEYDESDVQYYINMMGSDPVVDSVSLDFTTGKDGVLRDGSAVVCFKGSDKDGNDHIMKFNVTLGFSEIGTTSITPVSELGYDVYEYDFEGNRFKVEF